MDPKNTENTPPPEEYVSPPELCFPPPEFGASGDAGAAPKKRRRLRLLTAAAALLLLLWAWPHAAAPAAERPAPPEPGIPSAPSPTPTSAPTAEPTSEPVPELTAEPTPEPTPEPEPGVEVLYLCFSADYYVQMNFRAPEKILSAEGEIWETNFDSLELSFSVPAEEIAAGSSRYHFNDSEIYFRHWDEYTAPDAPYPELELRLSVQVEGENGPETLKCIEQVRPQLGWSLRYDPEDGEASDYSYPGCFSLTTYEDYEPASFAVGDADAAEPGVICVTAEIGGRRITMDDCEVIVKDFVLNDYLPAGAKPLYNTVLLIPRPEGVPEGGTAHFTVTQFLEGYGTPWVTELDVEY